MVDEADIDLVGGSSSQSGGRGVKRPAESPNPIPLRPSKRKAGPLPRDLCVRRPFSPMSPSSPSPPPSPLPLPSPSPSPSASPPTSLLIGDLQVRPDSPLPGVTSPMFSPPAIGSADCDHESDSLVIADYIADSSPETSLLNGTSKCTSVDEETPYDQLTITSTPLQVLPESEPETTPETLVSVLPITTRLVNGEAKGISFKDIQSVV